MAIGEMYCNSRKDILIICDSIVYDSRCPVGFRCITPGEAEVKFILEDSEIQIHEFNLNTDKRRNRIDTIINGFRYKLIDVLPYPQAGVEYQISDYSIEIIVAKKR
jgi:hypothetical protein